MKTFLAVAALLATSPAYADSMEPLPVTALSTLGIAGACALIVFAVVARAKQARRSHRLRRPVWLKPAYLPVTSAH